MLRHPGFKIGRFFGIDVTLHPTWFIPLVMFTIAVTSMLSDGVGLERTAIHYVVGFVTALAVFATLLAHEYGHALTARYFGIGTERIMLFLLGGVAQIKDEPKTAMQEFLVAIMGPAVSVACAIIFGAFAFLGFYFNWPTLLVQPLYVIAIINIVLVLFNMIPGFPMDGGRVLRSIVWGVTGDYLKATEVAGMFGRGVGWLLLLGGIFIVLSGNFGGLMWVALGIFLGWLAKTSISQARFKSAVDNVSVRDLMRPVQVVVPAELSVGDVVRDFIYRLHGDRYPVVRDHSLLGFISAEDISRLDRTQWPMTPAANLARPYAKSEMLDPDLNAWIALQRVHRSGKPQLPVFMGRRLVGHIFVQDIMNYLQSMSAIPPQVSRRPKMFAQW